MNSAAERVRKFLHEWRKMRRPETIHGLHSGVEGREADLFVRDLAHLVDLAERFEKHLKGCGND